MSPPNLNYGEIISGRKILETVEVISTIPLDSKQIFFCPSSEVIEISMNEDRNSILNLANKNRMLYRYVLNIVILAKQEKGELKEHIDILIKNYKGRDRIFRVSLTGHIIPVLNVEPEFLFLGYITPAKNVHKEVVITNKENSGFEVISVNLPNNITYSYEITEILPNKKNIGINLTFDKMDNRIKRFYVNIKVKQGTEIKEFNIPCICLGEVTK